MIRPAKLGNRLRTPAGAISATGAAALSFLVAWEGNKLIPYKDVVSVWTVCAGETQNVDRNRVYTKAECDEINIKAAERYLPEKCVTRPMATPTYIAFLSFGYNLGSGTFCGKIAPLYNAGREREACDRMLLYNRAGGVVWKGLVRRRAAEHKLCVQGIGQ